MKCDFLSNYISQKYGVLILISFFVFSVLFVTWESNNAWNEPSQGFWEVAFSDPQSENVVDFILANHQKEDVFSYEVIVDGVVVHKDSMKISFGEKRLVSVKEAVRKRATDIITIRVRDSLGVERVIYKRR